MRSQYGLDRRVSRHYDLVFGQVPEPGQIPELLLSRNIMIRVLCLCQIASIAQTFVLLYILIKIIFKIYKFKLDIKNKDSFYVLFLLTVFIILFCLLYSAINQCILYQIFLYRLGRSRNIRERRNARYKKNQSAKDKKD